jgi:hypothetical protein
LIRPYSALKESPTTSIFLKGPCLSELEVARVLSLVLLGAPWAKGGRIKHRMTMDHARAKNSNCWSAAQRSKKGAVREFKAKVERQYKVFGPGGSLD